ncbi:MAG: lipopolysaccharide biosynthesis protein [Granulosicoccus sp.]
MIVKAIKRILPKGLMARGVTVLAGSNAVGQVIALAVSPLLTRLYTPEDFGLLAVYMSLTTILGVIVCLRYERAIVLPEADTDGVTVAVLCLLSVLLSTLLTLIGILFFAEQLTSLLSTPQLKPFLWALPISVLLLGMFTAFRFWAIRQNAYGQIGQARIKQVLASVFVQIAAYPLGAFGLIGGQLANQGAGSLSLGKRLFAQPGIRAVSVAGIWAMAKRYKDLPLVSVWSGLLNRTSAQLPTLMFAALFGPAVAGLYALATRVVNTPAGVMSGALNSVLFSNAASASRQGTLGKLTSNTHRRLVAVAMPPLLLLALISPQLFAWVFGQQWLQSGQFAQWVVILVYFSICAAPLVMIFTVLEKQLHDFIFQALLTATRFAMILWGAHLESALIAIALYCVGSGVCYMILLFWIAVLVGEGPGMVVKPLLSAIPVSVLTSAPVLVALYLDVSVMLSLLAVALSTILVGIHVYRQLRLSYKK